MHEVDAMPRCYILYSTYLHGLCLQLGSNSTLVPFACVRAHQAPLIESTHRPGRHCLLHQARSAVRCWASRMKGELHPTRNRFCDGLSCISMTASNGLICFLVWPLPGTAMDIYIYCVTASWLSYRINTVWVRDTIIPLVRS